MKKGAATGSKILIAAIATFVLATGSTFAQTVVFSPGTETNRLHPLVPPVTTGDTTMPVSPLLDDPLQPPIAAVPEPTTVAMMVLGAGLLTGAQRFRRKLR